MINFHIKAYFWKDTAILASQSSQNNAVLVDCLNLPGEKLKQWMTGLRTLSQQVQLQEGGSEEFCLGYNEAVQRAQELLRLIDGAAKKLAPYGELAAGQSAAPLSDCLNEHYPYWEAGKGLEHFNDPGFDQDGFSNDYGHIVRLPDGSYNFYVEKFLPDWQDLTGKDPETLRMVRGTNDAIRRLFDPYVSFVQEIQRAQKAYTELLDRIHEKNKYLDDEELAACYAQYLRDTESRSERERIALAPSLLRMRQEVCRLRGERELLCESYEFESLGAFLYIDFFRGLHRGYLPKRCSNCGQYFLLAGGKYTNYCERPLKSDRSKTCRDIGARKKYDDKCKADPVWLTYNRAYKAHYARYMKKRMTAEAFEEWSAYAVQLRTEAENGALSLEDYTEAIKK